MQFNDWNFSFPESVLETLRALDEIKLPASTVALYKAWNASVPSFELPGIVAAMKEYTAIADQLSDMMSATKLYLGLEDFIDSAQLASLSNAAASVLPLIDTTVFDAIRNTAAITDAFRNSDWDWAAKAYSEAVEPRETLYADAVGSVSAAESLTPEIKAEIAADITQVISNPNSAQQTSQQKYIKWKEQHPFLADIYMQVLFPLLVSLIVSGFSLTIGKALVAKDARVYEEPSSKSTVVVNVTVEQHVNIVNVVPYYYEVEITDPETGEVMTGYVYKGNIMLNEPDVASVQEDDETVTEDTVPTDNAPNENVDITK